MVGPGRVPLTRARVVDAALDLVDRFGVEALSMRKLGAALGVEAMSLYTYVTSKDDLLNAVADRLLELVELPAGPATEGAWRDAVVELCAAVRRTGLAHPRAFPLLVTQKRASLDSWAPILAGFDLLRGAGLDDAEAIRAVNAVSAFLIGSILLEIAAVANRGGQRGPYIPIDAVPADRPLLRAFIASPHPSNFAEDFDGGIGLLLDAIETRVRAKPAAEEGVHTG